MIERLRELAGTFAIDVCAYAVMSDHLHLVLRIGAERAEGWTEDELIERWQRLFGLPVLIIRYRFGVSMSKVELDVVAERLEEWRPRLADLSCLSESIARRANAQDNCTGRFWEGRLKSQALLDVAARHRLPRICLHEVCHGGDSTAISGVHAGRLRYPGPAILLELRRTSAGCPGLVNK